ncbi:stress response translation initiation inhibitor YciH [Candidatus Woesearchaeota archaeon]|nr:stress response translation initiation inhibitor YciH [Candidatus Woesearchaeota archaeon]
MSEICPVCGLPKELCQCSAVAREKQKIVVKMEKRRFGKPTTIIKGLDATEIDLKKTAKQLKEKLACGGTVKDSTIELQGDHRQKLKDVLIKIGFPADSIEIR